MAKIAQAMLAWLDAERAAAELRIGTDSVDALVRDERYGRALEIWARWAEAEMTMAAAEIEAMRMAAELRKA